MMKEKDTTGKFQVLYFYLRRALRIWPVYSLVLCVALVFSYCFPAKFGLPAQPIENWWHYFIFTGNFDAVRHSYEGITALSNKISRITWSVAIEEQFYLLWPIILLVSKKRFLYFIVGVILIGLSTKIYYLNDKLFYFHTASGFYFLALGSLGGYLAFKHPSQIKTIRIPLIIKVAPYVGSIFILFLLPDIERLTGSLVWGEFLFSILFLWILIDQTIIEKPIFRFYQIPSLEFIGKYTYGMYLYHSIVILIFRHLTQWKMTLIWHPFAESVIIFGITLLISILSFRFIEGPFLQLKESFSLVKSGRNK